MHALPHTAHTPEAHIDQALATGDLQRALQMATSAEAQQPGNAGIAHRMGVTLLGLNRVHEAFAKFNQALRLDPLTVDTRLALARAYLGMHDGWTATAWASDACRITPQQPSLWLELAHMLTSQGRDTELETALRLGVAANPQDKPLVRALGEHCLRHKRHLDAAKVYVDLLNLDDQDTHTLLQCGVCMERLGDLPASVRFYRQALGIDPALVDGHVCLAGVLWRLADFEGALLHAQEAVRIAPKHPAALRIHGTSLLHVNRLPEAEAQVRRALALKPDCPATLIDLALLLLLAGKFEPGWQAYERRWADTTRMTRPAFFNPALEWQGPALQPVAGKRVVIYAEQGLGDVINFVRYAAVLQADGATVYCVVQPELALLVDSMPGVVCLKPHLTIEADYHVALLELPLHYRTNETNVPGHTPYLHAPPAKTAHWRAKLAPWDGQLKVGIAWAGSFAHANQHNRSMPLSEFAAILRMPGVQCFSLQKQSGGIYTDIDTDTDRDTPPSTKKLVDFTSQWADFTDSAAMVTSLDLVISVDSSVIHLAGALNIPTWTILPPNPDWRWLLQPPTTAWYPSMTLYRRGHIEARSAQMARVATDLATLLAQRADKATTAGERKQLPMSTYA